MKLAGHSLESPRRWWFAIPGLGEIRFYRFGVEVYIGPSRNFVAIDMGTLGWGLSRVKG